MKKLISVLMILGIFSATAFAGSVSLPVSQDSQSWGKIDSLSQGSLAEDVQTASMAEDLFDGVRGIPMTQEETQAVEGEGFWSTFASVVVGSTLGGFTGTLVGGSVSFGSLSIPGYIVGAVSGGISSGIAAVAADSFAVKYSLGF